MSSVSPSDSASSTGGPPPDSDISIDCILTMPSVTSLYCPEQYCDTKGCDDHPRFMVCIRVSSYVISKDISFKNGKIHHIIVGGKKNTLGTLKSMDRCGKGVILTFISFLDTSKEVKYYFEVIDKGYGVFFDESYINQYCEFYYLYGTDEGCGNFNKP